MSPEDGGRETAKASIYPKKKKKCVLARYHLKITRDHRLKNDRAGHDKSGTKQQESAGFG